MRHILIDIARRHPRTPENRAAQEVSLDEALVVLVERGPDLVALDDALNALAALDPLKSRIVELRFFGGLSAKEAAEVLKISPNKLKYEWESAKAWLYRELSNQ